MPNLDQLFAKNKAWAEKIRRRNPDFFTELSRQQSPSYLWIGCADSRVPANEIVDLLPGELFVHRNIANVVVHTDLNCLSVMQFAVDVLNIRHIIVCGHYGCSGVNAALHRDRIGLADNWLQHVQDVRHKHERKLECLPAEGSDRCDKLCELNVVEQVRNVCTPPSCATGGPAARNSPSTVGFTGSRMACCATSTARPRAPKPRRATMTRRSKRCKDFWQIRFRQTASRGMP